MKNLKTRGLAIAAAAALIAVLGPGSSSATVLCESTTSPCATRWGTGVQIIGSLREKTESSLAGLATLRCKKSTLVAKIQKEGALTETVVAPIETLTFEECSGCVVNMVKKGELEIHHIAGTDHGTVTGKGIEITVTCNGVPCLFGTKAGGTDLGTLTGGKVLGEHALLDINASLDWLGDGTEGLCGKSATWTAEYTITAPKPLYVVDA